MLQHDGQQSGNGCPDYANLKRHLRTKTIDELWDELDALHEKEVETGIDADPHIVQEYLAAIEEISPTPQEPEEADKAWERFTSSHPELFPAEESAPTGMPAAAEAPAIAKAPAAAKKPNSSEAATRTKLAQVTKKTPRSRPPIGRILLAAALAGMVVTGTAVAYQWPDYIITWGKEILGIAPATSGSMVLSEPTEEGFTTIEDALEYIGASDAAMPTWVPERYSIQQISVQESPLYSMAITKYASANSNMIIRISHYNETEHVPDLNSEKDENTYRNEYDVDGILYCFSENEGTFQISWRAEDCLCSISGDFSEQEAKDIIDSIYRS